MEEELLNTIIKNNDTPMYVFDIREAKKRIEFLKNNLPPKVKLCYAVKANTFIVKDIEKYVDRFEICSLGEFKICNSKRVSADKMLISGVNKSDKMINEIVNNNVDFFTIESMEQYKKLKQLNKHLKIMPRLTSGNQFGINEVDIEDIIKDNLENNYFNIIGIQYFSGTQKLSMKKQKRELEYVDDFIKRIEEKYNFKINELEFGTGFPVAYFENMEFDEDTYMKEFSEIIHNMRFDGNIVLEIGRSIVASCGVYITKVVDKKTNNNENYAIVDGGINHLVYYGQSMAMRIPQIEVLPKRKSNGNEKWNIFGSLCTINDILVKQLSVNNLKIGDILIFKNTGAYSMTEGISLFLSRDLPKIIKINEDETIETLRETKETYDLNM